MPPKRQTYHDSRLSPSTSSLLPNTYLSGFNNPQSTARRCGLTNGLGAFKQGNESGWAQVLVYTSH